MKAVVGFLFLALLAVSHAAVQKYSVKGRLMCGEAPASGILVKLIDKGKQCATATAGPVIPLVCTV